MIVTGLRQRPSIDVAANTSSRAVANSVQLEYYLQRHSLQTFLFHFTHKRQGRRQIRDRCASNVPPPPPDTTWLFGLRQRPSLDIATNTSGRSVTNDIQLPSVISSVIRSRYSPRLTSTLVGSSSAANSPFPRVATCCSVWKRTVVLLWQHNSRAMWRMKYLHTMMFNSLFRYK